MGIRPDEISNIIKNQIKNYKAQTDERETGTVITVGDGIVRAFGLENCMANELVRFEGGEYGMAAPMRSGKAPRFPEPEMSWPSLWARA